MPKTVERIDILWDEMWTLKDKIDMEAEFQKFAESNEDMRELWSEYELLKNESKPKRLPTKDEYRRRIANGLTVRKEWSDPMYSCPLCGGAVRRKVNYALPLYPPKFLYRCDNCENEEAGE